MHDDSLSALHRRTSAAYADQVAIRFRRNGEVHTRSWARYRDDADRAATALLALGVEAGDRVAILASNRYEWVVADIAILAVGGVCVAIHANASPKQLHEQLVHCGAKGLFLETQQQLDALVRSVARGEALAELRFVIGFDARVQAKGLSSWDWCSVLTAAPETDAVLKRERSIQAASLASIVYTSGTTGDAKGVMLSHQNFLATLQAFDDTQPLAAGKRLCGWLPLSHVFGRCVDHYLSIRFAASLWMTSNPAEILEDLAEAKPAWFFAVPRFFEKFWLKLAGLATEQRALALRAALGHEIERVSCGGAPLSSAVAAGFEALGLPLREGYGLSEATAVVSMQQGERFRCGTVGPALSGTELRIADDGEVLTRGPHVMLGYWRDPEASAAAIVDGWLYTGDYGSLDDDGFLTITGRKKDLFVTSHGKNVSPVRLERLLLEDPVIEQAILIGDGRPYLCVLLVPDLAVLSMAAPAIAGFDVDEDGFCRQEAVVQFFSNRVRARMKELASWEQVRRVLVLGRPLSQAKGEITLKHEARRNVLLRAFSEAIDALYT